MIIHFHILLFIPKSSKVKAVGVWWRIITRRSQPDHGQDNEHPGGHPFQPRWIFQGHCWSVVDLPLCCYIMDPWHCRLLLRWPEVHWLWECQGCSAQRWCHLLASRFVLCIHWTCRISELFESRPLTHRSRCASSNGLWLGMSPCFQTWLRWRLIKQQPTKTKRISLKQLSEKSGSSAKFMDLRPSCFDSFWCIQLWFKDSKASFNGGQACSWPTASVVHEHRTSDSELLTLSSKSSTVDIEIDDVNILNIICE